VWFELGRLNKINMTLHHRAKSILLARDGVGTQHLNDLSVEALMQLHTEHQLQRIELELVYEELRRVSAERDELLQGDKRLEQDTVSRLHKDLLLMIASGAPLDDTLNALSLAIETHFGNLICSVLLAEEDGKSLKYGAGPSLPEAFRAATICVPVRDSFGSCGTAAFRRELVVVEDIRLDPLWEGVRDLAASVELVACWSTPIVCPNGQLLGTFAIYKREPARPSPEHLQFLGLATQIAIIAINKERQDKTLRDRKRELRLIADAVPGPIGRLDANFRFLFVNEFFTHLTGNSRESLIGLHMSDVLGKLFCEKLMPFTDRAVNGEAVCFELQHSNSQAATMTLLIHLIPEMDRDQKVIGFFIVGSDITEFRKAQAEREEALVRLEKIAKEVPGVVFQFRLRPDGTSSLPYASEGIKELYSITPEEFLQDAARLLAMHHPDDQAKMDESIRKSARELSPWKQEFRLLAKDGRTRWISGNSIPEREPDGSTLWHGFLADVTDRIEAEAVNEELQSQLRESQKLEAVGTLAGGIAHDFNNILAIILSNTELAQLKITNATITNATIPNAPNQAVVDHLEEIKKASVRAKCLVNQIISFSRRQRTNLKPTQLASVIEESVRLLLALFPARVSIQVHQAADVPLILADATLMEQVIINLATNSMQAMHGRAGQIDIAIESMAMTPVNQDQWATIEQSQPAPWVCIVVADNGCGIDAAIQSRIFEPFFTTKKVGEGTGLGLSVVHGIVTSHGGTISVESKPGHGTTFTICLPAISSRQGCVPAVPESTTEIAIQEAETKSTHSQHVLVVDDDEPVLTSFKFLLEHLGYLVSDYTNSREAFEAFCVDPSEFELVLVDYNMPGMSGVEMARKLRSMRSDIPIAITSGYIDADLRSQAIAVGVQDVISKPCEIADLKAIVSRLLA
jgi:two-component system, cell cycle sensor histidine kinase and response regulator CckA